MKKRTKIIFILLVMIVAAGSFVFYQTFYATHRNIASEKVDFLMPATNLQLEYSKEYSEANTMYADKVIQVNGLITSVDQNTIMLDDIVQIDFLNEIGVKLIQGDSLTVKGRCVGYDDLLEVVKLDQATVVIN